jgi:hypothetical protein
MGVDDLQDDHCVDTAPVEPVIRKCRPGERVGSDDQPEWMLQIE